MVRGLEEDIHSFTILKARQLGITTIMLALDLFWHYEHDGMQGTLAADSEENRDMFRNTLTTYHDGLPATHRIKLIQNNRNFMTWANRSRVFMQIGGGVKRKGGKGRGKGITFIHATECSSWEDEESLASIISSLAELNPLRLHIFESTARGFNLFQEMYSEAKKAVTEKAIFIGWWQNELYQKGPDTNEYRVYWDGNMTAPEREWVRAVKLMYGHDITPEQIAWWRWKIAEKIHDENYMMQEFPPTEEHAFILTGKNFFSIPKVQELSDAIKMEPEPVYYRFKFGIDFLDTECDETNEKMGQLAIWEEPDPAAIYSIGCDPAWGSETWADRSVVEVYRCYADRFEQVAEFCTPEITTRKFAGVICYLAGAYKNSMVNLELNGPGEDVLGEIDNLRRQAGFSGRTPEGKTLRDVVGNMVYFLYRKLDSPFGGAVYHWKTTAATKERAMNAFKNMVDIGEAALHSRKLIEEMKIIVREPDSGFLGASGRKKDDCTIASAIAAENHSRYIKMKLKQSGITWGKESARRRKVEETGMPDTPQSATARRLVGTYLGSLGIKYGTE